MKVVGASLDNGLLYVAVVETVQPQVTEQKAA
jgi:hypothetical protein